MDRQKRLKIILLVSFLLTGTCLMAQEHRKAFGQNRIQYKNFDWYYYSTDEFDVHYYAQGQEYAKLALDYLSEEYEKLTDLLGYAPYAKTKIFLYNSKIDLQQSNIGVDGPTFTIAGQTNFVKLQVEIAYPGSITAFKQELTKQVSNMLIQDMMFGGSLAEMFQSAYLLNLPEWFVAGAANYVSHGWDVRMDDFMRDFLSNRKIKKLSKLEGEHAALTGQSVWNYIALKYGKSNISNILNLTRIIRNVENSIASTLGIPFKQFMFEWMEYYRNANGPVAGAYVRPDQAEILSGKNGRRMSFHHVKISPDGTKVAYSENYKGKYSITIRDLNSGKESKVVKGGAYVINQIVDYELPLIDWISDSQLGVIQSWYGHNSLLIYDLNTNAKIRKSLNRFNQIKDIGFNDNGKLAVISADVRGQNDLYLISLRRNAIKRLTKDQWDDIDPKFIPGTDAIVFSSNRPNDSLDHKMTNISEVTNKFNLFAFDLDTTRKVLYRMTNTLSNDTKPLPVSRNEVLFISDQKGIANLYRYNLNDSIYHQVSNFSASIQDYDINRNTNDMSFLMMDGGRDKLFMIKNFDSKQSTFTPQTVRNQLEQIEFIRKRREKNLEKQNSGEVLPEAERPVAEEEKPEAETTEGEVFDESGDEFIDTDNYIFEDDKSEGKEETFSFLSNYRKLQKEPTVTGPLPYKTAFTADNVITSFVIDPIRGFGIFLETEMNDVLENHKLYGGFLSITDLRSGDFFAEYQFIKYRIDFRARYDRRSLLIERGFSNELIQKYLMNTYTVGVALPLGVSSRINLSPFFTVTNFYNLNADKVLNNTIAAEHADNSRNTYGGLKAEFVFDNTLTNGLNLFEGTRGKVVFQHYAGLSDSNKSFSSLTVDLRHYQKIYRELIFAARVYYGKSFGRNPRRYMLGGMDNWVFNKREDSSLDNDPSMTPETGVNSDSPLLFTNTRDNSDILFTEFVNLRGFNYNEMYGTDVLTFNAEVRVPIIKIFHRGSISSNFLRNLQFIGFYDIGSSWTGQSPFSDQNTINTKNVTFGDAPFEATIKTSRNPWLSSYGFGIRTVLLGYYMRFDIAKPIEDYTVGAAKRYLTLGYDF